MQDLDETEIDAISGGDMTDAAAAIDIGLGAVAIGMGGVGLVALGTVGVSLGFAYVGARIAHVF